MKRSLTLFLTLVSLFLGDLVFAQNQISVNALTGAANVVIPVYSISRGQVTFPINLVYSSSGVKPKDVEGSAGIVWQIQAGGEISRLLRGLPDDCKKDASSVSRLGWLYNTNSTKINNFAIANNGTANCTNETADINYINANFSDLSDTEPDIFSVSAPGLSCQLLFDNNHTIRVLDYQDLVVTYTTNNVTTDPLYGAITSFTITNNKGVQYLFSVPERVNQTAYTNTASLINGTANYFTNAYNQFKNGISYYSDWFLTSITDVNGNGIMLNYTPALTKGSENDISLYAGTAAGATVEKPQYAMYANITPQLLTGIQANDNGILTPMFTLSYIANSSGTNQNMISSIAGLGHNFSFNYNSIASTDSKKTYNRNFLSGFSDPGCSTPVSYAFDYAGVTGLTTVLCDSATTHTDYWGYYSSSSYTSAVPAIYVNPSNNAYQRYAIYSPSVGSDYTYTLTANTRTVDPVNITAGSLNKITYNQGGTTTITYESNDYLDKPSNTVVKGGGIRVKQITDYDGINTANNIVRNYTYTDPVSGLSSGKPTSLPVFGFTTPYTGGATGSDYWNYSTMRSANDLSPEDHSICYTYSRVSQTNAGSTLFQYYLPATNWDNTAIPACNGCTTADWTPTTQYTSRSTCTSYGPVKNDIDSYPFAPNTNYDFERGLLQKETNFTDAGTEVSETNYSYTRTSAPVSFNAFKWENNQGVTAYAKYKIYFGTSELTSQVTKKVFDSPTLTLAQTTTTNLTYGSANHKLVTKLQVTGSDNSIVTTNISYVKDFTLSAGSNPNVTALYNMKQLNINVPVESYIQVKRGTAAALTTKASLNLFNSFVPVSSARYLQSQTLKFYSADGVLDFQPYTITAQTANPDSRYFAIANYSAYDNSGNLLTGDDAHKNVQTVITDHTSNNPVAIFKNTASNEIAFNDFDSNVPTGINFIANPNNGSTQTGGHTGNSWYLSGSQVFVKSITKKVSAGNYVLSAWINSSAVGTLNVSLTNTSSQTSSYTESFGNTGGIWKYFEWKVPVSNMTPTFTVQFGASTAIGIDDIVFYPETAMISTLAYDPVSYSKIAETNTNGVSAYYQNDQWGRVLFTYDQDKNIAAKRTFFSSDVLAQDITPSIGFSPSTVIVTSPVSFTANSPACVTGTTFTWNFGDGTAPVTAMNGNLQSHSYSATGTYTVNVTAVNPVLGTKTSSVSVTVQPQPLTVNICQSGVTYWDNCNFVSLNTVACGSNPNDNMDSYYTVTSIGGTVNGTLTYQWQVSYDNGGTWSNIGPNANQYIVPMGAKKQACRIRCVITSSTNQTATSGYVLFNVRNC